LWDNNIDKDPPFQTSFLSYNLDRFYLFLLVYAKPKYLFYNHHPLPEKMVVGNLLVYNYKVLLFALKVIPM